MQQALLSIPIGANTKRTKIKITNHSLTLHTPASIKSVIPINLSHSKNDTSSHLLISPKKLMHFSPALRTPKFLAILVAEIWISSKTPPFSPGTGTIITMKIEISDICNFVALILSKNIVINIAFQHRITLKYLHNKQQLIEVKQRNSELSHTFIFYWSLHNIRKLERKCFYRSLIVFYASGQ